MCNLGGFTSQMKLLAGAAPLTGLQHVKRIRKAPSTGTAAAKLNILLCPVAAPDPLRCASPSTLAARAAPACGTLAAAKNGGPESVVERSAHGATVPAGRAAAGNRVAMLPETVQRLIADNSLLPYKVQVRQLLCPLI